jgi:ribosomal protein L14
MPVGVRCVESVPLATTEMGARELMKAHVRSARTVRMATIGQDALVATQECVSSARLATTESIARAVVDRTKDNARSVGTVTRLRTATVAPELTQEFVCCARLVLSVTTVHRALESVSLAHPAPQASGDLSVSV